MKNLIKTTLLAILLLTLSCSKDDGEDPIIPVTVTEMNPTRGPKGTIIGFRGTNFGTDASKIQVFFDDIETEVLGITDTQIKTIVPAKAYVGAVTLIIDGKEFTDYNFNYEISDINVSTFAGSEVSGNLDGNGSNAQFGNAYGITLDASGNFYVVDGSNHRIRKITPAGTVSTLAGNTNGFADGNGPNASFSNPIGIAIDNEGNTYVADFLNHKIRKITPAGLVSTLAGSTAGFADGKGANAKFNEPINVTVDADNNVYVADSKNAKIRKITPDGAVTTIAGSSIGFADGASANAQFRTPVGMVFDATGNMYVADLGNHKIRKITPSGDVSTIAGSTLGFKDSEGADAQFFQPYMLAIDALGNLYVTDSNNHKIRKINTKGQVSTVVGSTVGFADGNGTNAQFNRPIGLAIDDNYTLYVVDLLNTRIRKITQE